MGSGRIRACAVWAAVSVALGACLAAPDEDLEEDVGGLDEALEIGDSGGGDAEPIDGVAVEKKTKSCESDKKIGTPPRPVAKCSVTCSSGEPKCITQTESCRAYCAGTDAQGESTCSSESSSDDGKVTCKVPPAGKTCTKQAQCSSTAYGCSGSCDDPT